MNDIERTPDRPEYTKVEEDLLNLDDEIVVVPSPGEDGSNLAEKIENIRRELRTLI